MGDIPGLDYSPRGRPWALVAETASRQHHQVRHDQLLAAGLTVEQVKWAVKRDRLHRVHHEVYAVGAPARGERARMMAAVLATDGVLAEQSAGALWGFWENDRSDEHVIVARSARWRHRGVRPHRPRSFDRVRDSVVVDGIRVTTPARTLLDLAAVLATRQLKKALENARVRGLVDDDALRDVLARCPTHRGARRLGRALTGPRTKSALERRFVRLCREHGLPEPRVNTRFAGVEVDMLFDGLAVELDGDQHAGAWAEDAARDAAVAAAGVPTLRLTWWDVDRNDARTAARVRTALGRRPGE
jgi:very-short-patch-repair endonuclease